MNKYRSIEDYVSGDLGVECCDHCHGEPGDCPDDEVLLPPVSAIDLISRAHRLLVNGGNQFDIAVLVGDLREFIVRDNPLAVLP